MAFVTGGAEERRTQCQGWTQGPDKSLRRTGHSYPKSSLKSFLHRGRKKFRLIEKLHLQHLYLHDR